MTAVPVLSSYVGDFYDVWGIAGELVFFVGDGPIATRHLRYAGSL